MPLEIFLLLAPLLFYFLPATVPIWRPFLIIWMLLGIVLAAYWISGFSSSEPRGLGVAIDNFIRVILTASWIAAAIVQLVRARAHARGYEEYRHWMMVIFGACLAVVAAIVAANAI